MIITSGVWASFDMMRANLINKIHPVHKTHGDFHAKLDIASAIPLRWLPAFVLDRGAACPSLAEFSSDRVLPLGDPKIILMDRS